MGMLFDGPSAQTMIDPQMMMLIQNPQAMAMMQQNPQAMAMMQQGLAMMQQNPQAMAMMQQNPQMQTPATMGAQPAAAPPDYNACAGVPLAFCGQCGTKNSGNP